MDFEKVYKVYNRLQDAESKELFSIRTEYAISGNRFEFIDRIAKYGHHVQMPKLFVKKLHESEGIIVYGCGQEGIVAKRAIENCGFSIACFCDKDIPENGTVEGVKVILPDVAMEKFASYLFVIGSTRYAREMYVNLLKGGVTDNHIYLSELGMVAGFDAEHQYFDLFEPKANEVFVDAGCYDGKTTELFRKWSKNTYKQIYCYEPLLKQARLLERKVESEWKNVKLITGGVWNKSETQSFFENGTGSYIRDNGGCTINCVTIDDTVDGEVTYIKMDIEGAELKALEGAQKTIKKYKPKLAISVYHKPEDLFEIPEYILDLVPEYKFWIRHYSTNIWETVLYAICGK